MMRRRFGRRRWRGGNGGESGSGRPPVDGSWLARIAESGLAGTARLEPLRYEDVPDWLCVTGVGEGPAGEKVIVSFSPSSGVSALLGAMVAGARQAAEPGFRGRALAIAPSWRGIDRRLLGLVTGLPLELTALAASALGEEGGVEAEPHVAGLATPPELAGAGLAAASERTRFERALAGLRGLAAKHGGVVRGGDGAAELVLLARPVARLRAGVEGPVLDVLEPARATYRLAGEDLADALDRLEGQLRKFLSDRTIRDGEEGLRARGWEALAAASGARSVRAWPAGEDCAAADFAAVDAEGTPLVGALRRRLDLGVLAGALEAALRLEPLFGALLAQAPPPVRLGAPALTLAGVEIPAAVDLALKHLGLASRTFSLRESGTSVELSPRGSAAAATTTATPMPAPVAPRRSFLPPGVAPAAPRETPPFAAAPAPSEAPLFREPPREVPGFDGRGQERDEEGEEGDESAEAGEATEALDGDGAPRRGRRRRRGRRGRRDAPEGEGASDREREAPPRERPAEERAEGPAAPRPFLEMSLFDLDDEPAESDEPRGRGRRRRGGRRRGRGTGAESESGDDEGEAAGEAARPPQRAAAEPADDEDADALLELSPDAPELEEPEPQYEEGDLEEVPLTASERLRMERERRRRAQLAAAPPASAEDGDEGELGAAAIEPELPRGRAAILAHDDRHSILGALLLAREVRSIEGLWIYPQSELMTFFRGVATDLRPNTPIYIVGFEAKPSHDAIQAAALYRGRIAWFDHHVWPPEDLHAMRQAIGASLLHVTPATESVLPAVLTLCGRRSRFTDKLVDLLNGAFTQHDWERWGRLWWHRLGELGKRRGDHRADLEPLLAGRPSDLAREASRVPPPPPPAEAEFAASRDFRLVHFGGYGLVVCEVPAELDAALAARILRERFGAALSLARREGSETCVLGADDSGGKALDVASMVDHLAEKLGWAEALPGGDHVARFRIRDLARHPERLDEAVAEIGMSRSLLEG